MKKPYATFRHTTTIGKRPGWCPLCWLVGCGKPAAIFCPKVSDPSRTIQAGLVDSFLCTHALGSTLMPHKIKRDSPPVSTHARHPDPGSAFLCYTSSCRLCLSLSRSLSPSLSPMTLSIAQRQKGMPTAFCHHSAPCGSYHLPQGAYRLGDEGLHAQRLYGPGPTGIADSSSSISSSIWL